MSAALQAAQAYCARGWNPLPLPFKAKKPTDDGWQNRVIGAADLPRYFNGNPQNVGVVLGPTSNGLTDVDLDCPEAIALAPYVLPQTGAIFGRQSAPASHWLYRSALASTSEDEKARISFKDPLRPAREAMVLEVRVGGYKGAQTVFPGSVHESDEEIRWDETGDPAEDFDNGLLKRAHLLASICLLARYWPGEGARHDAALSVGGFPARAGLKAQTIKYLVEAIARTAGDSEHQDRKATAEDAAQAFHAGKRARGYPELKKAFGEEAAKQVADWLAYRGSTDDTAESAEADTAALEILRLAKLPALRYEQERKDAAKALGLRASILDLLVKGERARLGFDDDDTVAPALYAHWNVEMAAEPIDGGILLRALKEAIRRYVFASDDHALVAALWIMFSWLHEQVTHSPILFVTSAERDSGKTTLLGVINFLARRSLQSVDISGAALFRSITKWEPTLIVDEADDALVDNVDLRSVINSGWTRGQGTVRCHPDTHEPELFSTFAPKGVAMKGRNLPDTTLSRSVIVTMRPRRADDPEEHAADFDHLDNETFARLRSQAMRWAADNGEMIARATPEIPPGFHNRRRANWKLRWPSRRWRTPSTPRSAWNCCGRSRSPSRPTRIGSPQPIWSPISPQTRPHGGRPTTRASRSRSGRLPTCLSHTESSPRRSSLATAAPREATCWRCSPTPSIASVLALLAPRIHPQQALLAPTPRFYPQPPPPTCFHGTFCDFHPQPAATRLRIEKTKYRLISTRWRRLRIESGVRGKKGQSAPIAAVLAAMKSPSVAGRPGCIVNAKIPIGTRSSARRANPEI
jgi:hypothetical protein